MKFVAPGYAMAISVFLLAPIVVVIGSSFTAGNFINFPPQGVSLRWYRAVWENGQFANALILSLEVATGAALLAGTIGAMAALGLHRRRFRGHEVLLQAFGLPLIIPEVVIGIASLQWFAGLGIRAGAPGLIAAHAVITLPYVIRLTLAGMAGSDPNLERAASGLGAGAWLTFCRVTWPALRSGLLAGLAFAFIVSFDDTGVSIFLVNSSIVTLPVQIFNYLSFNYDPIITAAGSVMVYLALIAVVLIDRLVGLGRTMPAQQGGPSGPLRTNR